MSFIFWYISQHHDSQAKGSKKTEQDDDEDINPFTNAAAKNIMPIPPSKQRWSTSKITKALWSSKYFCMYIFIILFKFLKGRCLMKMSHFSLVFKTSFCDNSTASYHLQGNSSTLYFNLQFTFFLELAISSLGVRRCRVSPIFRTPTGQILFLF